MKSRYEYSLLIIIGFALLLSHSGYSENIVGSQVAKNTKLEENTAVPILMEKNIIYDDGTGANISFCLPIYDKQIGRDVYYTKFRICVVKDGKCHLFADLSGAKTEDGKSFFGNIIIPSGLVDDAEIIMLGSPPKSTIGVIRKLKVKTLKKVSQ